MHSLRRTATVLAVLALAACSDNRDLVAPQLAAAAGARSSAIITSNGDGGVTATVNGPDNVAPGATANYTVSLTAPTAPSTADNPLDVVFVLDASGSEGTSNFELAKDAIVSQVNAMQWGTTNRAGIVEFSTEVQTHYTFTMNQTASAIAAVANDLTYTAGQTYTMDAMTAAAHVFEEAPRPGAMRVVVLLTDGVPDPLNTQNPCSTTTPAAAQLRNELAADSINTFIVGVGADIDPQTLGCLYDYDPTRFIPVADFTGIANALTATFDQLAGIRSVQYTATLPAGFTVGSITTPGASVSNGVLTWNAGVISGTTVQLPIALTAPAQFCGSLPTLTQQSLNYLNDGAATALTLPDQSITSTVSCDVTPPVITPTITGTHSGDWYSSDVTVHWDVADPESAVSSQTGCADATISANTDATGTTITCSATSAGGTGSQSVTIKRDATAPTVIGAVAGAQTNGWYTGSPTVTFTPTYGPSGAGTLAGCGPFTVTADGAFSYTCTATSAAGLAGTATVTGKRDASAPVISFAGATSYTVDQTIAITCSAADPTSGVATQTCPSASGPAYAAGLGSHTLSATATNGAGLTATATTTYTVSVTFNSLATLTEQLVPAKDVKPLTAALDAAEKAIAKDPKVKPIVIAVYTVAVRLLSPRVISAANAALLIKLAQAL